MKKEMDDKNQDIWTMRQAQQVVLPIAAQHVGQFSITTTLDKACYLLAEDLEAGDAFIMMGRQEIPLLAKGIALYVGQPIALILAPTVWQAHLFRQDLLVAYEGKSRLQIHSKNLSEKESSPRVANYVMRNVKKGFDLEYVFGAADQTFSQKYHVEHHLMNADDTLGAYAYYEDDKIIIYISSAWSQHIKQSLMRIFALKEEQIEIRLLTGVTSEDWMGVHVHLATCYVVWAVQVSGKASRLMISGRRPFFSANLGGDLRLQLDVALDREGKILAMQTHAVFDAGAYAIALNEVIDRMVWALGIRYHKVAFGVEIVAHLTHAEPALPEATFGVSVMNYVLEHFISVIKHQVNHITVRDWISLLYGKGDIDVYGHEWKHDTSYIALIKRLYTISNYTRKYDAYHQEALSRESKISENMLEPYRGIGMALGELPNGFLRHYYAGAMVEVILVSMYKVIVKINTSSTRGTLYDYWQKMVARMLGLEEEHIELQVAQDLERPKDLMRDGVVGSLMGSNVFQITMLLQEACEDLQKRRFREHLPISVVACDKRYRRWRESQFEGDLSDRMSRIAMASEVEVDVQTLNVYIRALYIVIDAGKILQPQQVVNQVELEIEKSLQYLSALHCYRVEARDYPDEILYRTALKPQCVVIDFLEKRHNNVKSRGVSGLVQTVLPVTQLKAISLALQSSVVHLSLQNEALYLQNQWIDMLAQVKKHHQGKKINEEELE